MFKLMRHLDKKIEAIWVYLDRVNVGGPRFGRLPPLFSPTKSPLTLPTLRHIGAQLDQPEAPETAIYNFSSPDPGPKPMEPSVL